MTAVGIDVSKGKSMAAALRPLGEAESTALYMNVEPGLYPAYPDGSRDDTHTQAAGARLYAELTARLLREQHLI